MSKRDRQSRADLKRLKELAAKPWHTMTAREQEEEASLYERVPGIPLSESRCSHGRNGCDWLERSGVAAESDSPFGLGLLLFLRF
jgi:hypothetical protein